MDQLNTLELLLKLWPVGAAIVALVLAVAEARFRTAIAAADLSALRSRVESFESHRTDDRDKVSKALEEIRLDIRELKVVLERQDRVNG